RQAVVAAHDDSRGVHHVQAVGEHFVEGQVRIAHRGGVTYRIVRVDAVHLGRLEQHVGADLDGTQRGGRVGGEERVAGAGGEDHDAALLQVSHRATADVVLAHLVDANGGHDPGLYAEPLERILHGERVHDGREHAHVVGGHPIHAGACQACAAKDVAAADDHGDLHRHQHDVLQFTGDALDDRRVDAVIPVAHQGFTGQLHQQDRKSV